MGHDPRHKFQLDEDFNDNILDESPECFEESSVVKSVRFPKRVQSTQRFLALNGDDSEEFSVVSEDEIYSNPSSGFSRRNEHAVSINLNARNYTKLEVIKAHEITKLLLWIHGVIAFAVLFCIVLIILANTVFMEIPSTDANNQALEGIAARYYYLPRAFELIFAIGNLVCFACVTSLAVVYTRRISFLRRKDRTHEQVWVIMLTIAAALYMNPFENIVRLLEKIDIEAQKALAYKELALFYDSIKDAAFSASTLFYVWASVHSYRILDGRLGIRFYIPKVVVVLLYVLLKIIAYWKSRIYFAEMPFASFVGMVYLFRILGEWRRSSVLWVTFITLYEIALVGGIIFDIRVTGKFLKTKDYMKYRTKQIGFRFFVYHNFTFYILFWLCYIMLLLALPPGAQIATQRVLNIVYVEVQYVPLGLYVFYLSYITIEAYANLPADAIGLRGWLNPQAPRIDSDVEPIMYRKREPKTLNTAANVMIMETTAMLFNFSWFAYYYNTPKMNGLKDPCATNFEYNIVEMISCEQTDTHALVVDGSDRIIVSFQGTKSRKNLMTDMNAFYAKLNRVLPTWEWSKSAKIHRGFAEAYLSVSDRVIHSIRGQYEYNPRPIYLTGHSLGGALATICALDCMANLDLGSNDMVVTTFGTPRVGNSSFRKVYNDHVPTHWRVVLAPDLVPNLPKVGYTHVGKKVLLTAAGDLFIDPNSMELSLWGVQAQSLIYHRKSAYLLAMRAWCKRHDRGSYTPPFWNWPFTEDDSRRFPDAQAKIAATYEENADTGLRILHQDAMIDALDMKELAPGPHRALYNWERLSRRVLLQRKLVAAR